MTVNKITRIEDWTWALVTLSDGSEHFIPPTDIISASGEAIPGAGTHRLGKCDLRLRLGTKAAPSKASAAIDADNWQLLRIVPNQDTAHTLWGLVIKATASYPKDGEGTLAVLVAPVEKLLHGRAAKSSSGAAIASSGATGDDYAKAIVTAAYTGTDPNGDSRAWEWGTLNVEANEAAADATEADLEENGGYVDDVIDALAVAYGFSYALQVSLSGGAFTFTFATSAPRGGSDKTSGAGRVVITDMGDAVPIADRALFDRSWFTNAQWTEGGGAVGKNAGSISAYGRWESVGRSPNAAHAGVTVDNSLPRTGDTWAIDQARRDGSYWMVRWEAGDLVLRNNARLGLTETSETIAAVMWEFVNKQLKIKVRWGDKTVKASDRMGDAMHGGGAGSGGDTTWADNGDISGVGPSNAAGGTLKHTPAAHVHKGALDVGAIGEILFTSGVLTLGIGAGLTATKNTNYAFTLAVSLAAGDLPAHDIISKHSYTGGAALDVVGLSAANTLAILTPSSDKSAGGSAILKSDANGYLTLARITAARLAIDASNYIDLSTSMRVYSGANVNFWAGGTLAFQVISGGGAYVKGGPLILYGVDLEVYSS